MSDTRRLFRTLAIANFFLYLGFNVWRAVFNNFAVEEIGVTAAQIGVIQAIREVPGLLGFTLGFLALVFSEMRIMGISVLILGVGLVLSGMSDMVSVLILGTLLMSIGFHLFYPSSNSLVLMGMGRDEAPKALGRLRSISAFAAVVGTLVVWIFIDGIEFGPIDIPAWGYRTTLIVIGVVVMLGSLFTLRDKIQKGTQREKRKVIFRRQYWLYYALTFMMGSRRHIFTTFAIFMLVQIYGISVRETATLFLINNLVNIYASAQLGKLVVRFGERKVLTFNFVGLIGVFLGYAFVPYLPVLFAPFCPGQRLFWVQPGHRVLFPKDRLFAGRDYQQREHGTDHQPRLGLDRPGGGRHPVGAGLALGHFSGRRGDRGDLVGTGAVHPDRSGAGGAGACRG